MKQVLHFFAVTPKGTSPPEGEICSSIKTCQSRTCFTRYWTGSPQERNSFEKCLVHGWHVLTFQARPKLSIHVSYKSSNIFVSASPSWDLENSWSCIGPWFACHRNNRANPHLLQVQKIEHGWTFPEHPIGIPTTVNHTEEISLRSRAKLLFWMEGSRRNKSRAAAVLGSPIKRAPDKRDASQPHNQKPRTSKKPKLHTLQSAHRHAIQIHLALPCHRPPRR